MKMPMKMWIAAAALSAIAPLHAQRESPADRLAIGSYGRLPTLEVSSPAFASGEAIPHPYTAYGENFSPALTWRGAPASTQSFVVLAEDPDAKAPAPSPFVHWSMYDLPVEQAALHESMPTTPRLPMLGGAHQGRTSRGTIGYVGPRPPAGDGVHHYHFEVFALDTKLGLPPGAPLSQIAAAMQGHVVAAGEVVGTFSR